MKKIYTLFALLLLCAATVKAVDVTVIDKSVAANTYGTISGSTFTTNAASGLAGVTVSGFTGTTATTFSYGACLAFQSTASGTVTLTAPDGYVITGYKLTARSNTYAVPYTLTPAAGGTAVTTTTGGVELSTSGLSEQSASFTYSAASANSFYIPSLVITVVDASATIVNVTYELYDSSDPTTLINSVVVSQEANSAVNVPTSLMNTAFYDYSVSGTIGDTDCTIIVTRTQKEGTVLSTKDLSNTVCYNITTNGRGSWYVPANGTQVTSTTKASVSIDGTSTPQQFAFISYEGNHYLYSVSEKKFVSKSGNYTTLTEKPGDNVTLLASTGSNLFPVVVAFQNGSYQAGISNGYTPAVITHYNDLADDGNRANLVEAGTFDPTQALAALENYFHPSATATYVISDANGVVYTSEPIPATVDETITELPTSLQRNFCTYEVTPTTIATGNNTIPVTVTYSLPFTVSTSFSDAVWHYATIRTSKYLRADDNYKDGNGRFQTNSTNEETDAYQWAFFGNPYSNFYVMNKNQGDSKYLYAATVPEFQTVDDPTTVDASLWVPSVNGNGFSLRSVTGANLYINDAGNGGNLGYWNSTAGATDEGSRWNTTLVPSDEEKFNQLVEYLKTIPYGTELNQYRISYQGQDYTEQLPALVEQFGNTGYSPMAYNVLKTLVANATMTLNMPEAGTFLRITSCHETILSGTPASNGRLSLTTDADASTIFYFDGTKLLNYEDGVYANGRDAGSVGGDGISYWFEESTMKMGAYAIRFNPDGKSDRFLYAWGTDRNYADQNGEDHANCVWTLEKLTELPITMHDGLDGRYYATFSAPVAISHVDVGIHKVKLEGNVAKYSEVTEQSATGIPANTGVLLISDSPDELLAFIGDYEGETIDTDLQPITAAVSSHEGLFFGLSTENKLGFFKLMEGGETAPTTGGFKAYLNAPASAKSVELVADNEATGVETIDGLTPNPSPNGKGSMYNLQGQRVNKAQKGVFIQNGKKVVVK